MQAWAAFAGAIALVVAAWIGSRTFDSWLRQRQTERLLDAGERILTLVYRAQDVFRTIRSPAQWADEVEKADQSLQETYPNLDLEPEGRRQRLRLSQIMLTRIADQNDYWKEFWELVPIARVHFGEEFEKAFRTIWVQRARISSTAMTYPNIDAEQDLEFYRKCQADFWDGVGHASGHDEIGAALEELVTRANAVILPTLRPEKPKSRRPTPKPPSA